MFKNDPPPLRRCFPICLAPSPFPLTFPSSSKSGPAVRVVQLEPEARLGSRMLIQGFVAPTVDLAWATHASLLAVVDARCNLYVYHVALPLTV